MTVQEMEGRFRCVNIDLRGVPEENSRGKGKKKMFEKKMVETFLRN